MAKDAAGLKPANANPWYVLMTLYDKTEGAAPGIAPHENNRTAWNTWVGSKLPQSLREILANEGFYLPARDDWHNRGAEIRTLHANEMARRNGEGYQYPGFPDSKDCRSIEMEGIEFQHHFSASGFVFPLSTRFVKSSFATGVDLSDAAFCQSAAFDSVTIGGDALFSRARFEGISTFNDAIFRKATMLNAVSFKGDTGFTGATFSAPADFHASCFGGVAMLDRTKFLSWARFEKVTFTGNARFGSASFGGAADFDEANFNSTVSLSGATFNSRASFKKAIFRGYCYFTGAHFGRTDVQKRCRADFTDTQFEKPTNFRNARFTSHYPVLAETIFHDRTSFTAKRECWPPVMHGRPHDPPKNRDGRQDPEEVLESCSVIRHALTKQGMTEAAHFFFRREMGVACQNGGWWQRLPYRLYHAFSGFGYSIARPSLWLLAFYVVPALVFHAVFSWTWIVAGSDYHPIQSFALSFANLFPIFGFHRQWFEPEFLLALNPWLKALGGVQTVFSLPLLFFLGLGLRTRFRLR